MIALLFLIVSAHAIDMTMKHLDSRVFRYPINKQQNLLLDCEASLGRTYVIKITVLVEVEI